jgi:hypothetical protein
MKMKMNIARGENLMTRAARLARLAAVAGMASLAATILAPHTHAEMLPGAIGNDGADGFDGSITSKARHEFDTRVSENAINGNGLLANGDHDVAHLSAWIGNPAEPNWFIVDLGASYELDNAVFYNYNNGTSGVAGSHRGVMEASIYLFNGASEPNASNPDLSGSPFVATGWTLFETDRFFAESPGTDPFVATDTVSFGGTDARFVALEIKNNHTITGADGFVGISEIQFFAVPQAPVVFTNITVNSAIRLDFATDDGQDYGLESTTSLTNLVWQDAGFTIRGDGGTRLALDPAGTATQIVYRIVPF